jgi:RNA polymerase sigma factor (sigma-70 family)
MVTAQKSDKELVDEYLSGNQNSFEILVNRHEKKVFTHIMLIVKNQHVAEDIFQDTFIKVIKCLRLGNYNEEGKFLPWVMRIAHNLVIDHFRKEKKMPYSRGGEDYDIFDTIVLRQGNVEDKMVKQQIQKDIKNLIKYLPDDQKEVLMMRYYHNLSFKEISDITNVSINTALGRMRYAIINLRKLINKKEIVVSA